MNAVSTFLSSAAEGLLYIVPKMMNGLFGVKRGFVVNLRIKECLTNYHKTRKVIYSAGGLHLALVPSGDHLQDIKYDEEGALVVHLMFETESSAAAFDGLVASSLLDGIEEECMESTITECTIPSSAAKLRRSEYKASQSTSPHGSSASSTVSGVVTRDDFYYQSLERLGYLQQLKPDGCHLIDSAMCAKVGVCTPADKSNMLFLGPSFHRMLDGTTGENGSLPTVYVEAVRVVPSDTVQDSNGKQRTRVDVRIVFRSQESASALAPSLQFKEETNRVDMCTFDSFVHVRDTDVFMKGAAWKVNKTKELWLEV